ncbi:MAG: aldo/keto reductase [Oscillospiraceae bacterium]|nr:aldo/keto reductase [Oscillospiraceae bacterium]
MEKIKQIYSSKLNTAISPLGFGLLYLPTDGNNLLPSAYELIDMAMESGVNFYDTGHLYLSGKCEEHTNSLLVKRYPRDKFLISAKMPSWMVTHEGHDAESIFYTQLENLGVDFIDFYLVQSIKGARWEKIVDSPMMEFLYSMRERGIIKHLGFSLHDNAEVLQKVLKAEWEFAMLQLNYIDWDFQNAKANYELLEKHNIPCMVMQPAGGGRLTNLPESCIEVLNAEQNGASQASWAMRFVAGLPNVVCTLSGMNSVAALEDNIKTFSDLKPLNESEFAALERVKNIFIDLSSIPCPGCRYCVGYCPQKLNISGIIRSYNDCVLFDIPLVNFFLNQDDSTNPCRCTGCDACLESCPQKLNIPKLLKKCHDEASSNRLGFHKEVIYNWVDSLDNGDTLVLFGTGMIGRGTLDYLLEYNRKPDYFCDNNEALWNSEIQGVPVISPQELKRTTALQKVKVFIAVLQDKEIARMLDEAGVIYETRDSLNAK